MEHYGNEEEYMEDNQDEQIGIGEDEEILDEFILEEGEDLEAKMKERGLIPDHTPEEKQILDELDAMEQNNMEDANAVLIDDSLCSFTLHTDSIFSVAALETSQNEILVASGSADDSTRIWKITSSSSSSNAEPTYQTESLYHLTGHKDSVVEVAFSNDGQYLATAGMDGQVGIWDAQNQFQLVTFLEGPSEAVNWIHWHPKGSVILCGTAEATTWMFNAKTKKCMNVFAGHSSNVTVGRFTPDGKLIITGSEDSTVRIWDPVSGASTVEFKGELFSDTAILSLACKEEDSNLFMVGSANGTISLGHIENKRVLAKLQGHAIESSVETVAFCSPFGQFAASGAMDNNVLVWDLNVLKPRNVLQHEKGIVKVQFDKTNPLIYSASIDRTIAIWDLRSGQRVKQLRGHHETVMDFVVTKNSNFLISGSDDHACLFFSTTPSAL